MFRALTVAPAPEAASDPSRVGPRWLKPAILGSALFIALLTIAAMILEQPMPESHLVATPIVMATVCAAWAAEVVGIGWSRPLFALSVALPIAVLELVGHSGPHLLFLMLLVTWVTYTGSHGEGLIGTGIAVAGLLVAVMADAIAGSLSASTWFSWSAGLVVVWLLARSLAAQQRLQKQGEELAVLQERQRLARELHDSVTQSLYSISLLAEASRRLVESGQKEQASEHLSTLGSSAEQALKEMRLLVYELRPTALQTEGLVGALRTRLDAVERRAGISASLHAPEGLALPSDAEAALYGVAQEALNNSLKHSGARSVAIEVSLDDGLAQMEVRDDGKGFSPDDSDGGFGLVSMRERVERLGGRLAIESVPGGGTAVRAAVPAEPA